MPDIPLLQDEDEFFLKETFRLAKKGLGWTNPNPIVGAVIVKKGKILAKGFHRKVGFPHAEIEALKDAQNAKGATLYVNLEPCIHWGRTPPCVKAIIKSGISQVVLSTLDPNLQVHGRGATQLQKSGIKIAVGGLGEEARRLNEAFFTFHEKKRPFIALKFAASLDGKIATSTSDSKWITNKKARSFARGLRGVYQAVLVGIGTIVKDNPHLGVRQKGKKDPLRIILDSSLKIPLSTLALRDGNVLIATTYRANKEKKRKLIEVGISVVEFPHDFIPLPKLIKELFNREVISILVEGGGKTLGHFVDARLVDKVYAFHAPLVIGGAKAVTAVAGKGAKTLKEAMYLGDLSYKRFGDNTLTIGYPKYAI